MILSRSLASVRPMGPYGIGRPYILDYKRGILKPDFRSEEWGRTRDKRVWTFDWQGFAEPWERVVRRLQDAFLLPTMQLNFGFSGQMQTSPPILGYTTAASISLGTGALDTAYIYGTSGKAAWTRLAMVDAKTFDTIYFYIASYTGTAANVNDITVEVRNDSGNKPGATVHDTIVVDPASATGWIAVPGFTFAGGANTVYWICVGDLDGNATDNAVVAHRHSVTFPNEITTRMGSIATDGFAAAPANPGFPGAQCVKYTSGSSGIPFSATAASTSSQNQRGLNINAGMTETLKVFGFMTGGAGSANLTAVSIFTGPALPDDATAGSWGVQIPNTTEQGFVGTPYTVPKETQTRFAFVYGGGVATAPAKLNIGTGTVAGLRAAMLGGGDMYWAEENTTPNPDDWTNDDVSAWPRAALLIENQIAVAGGSGGGLKLVGTGGLAG